MQDDNATVVVLSVPWGIVVTASSKRAPEDKSKDFARAYRIALGRGLVKLGRAILKSEGARGY